MHLKPVFILDEMIARLYFEPTQPLYEGI